MEALVLALAWTAVVLAVRFALVRGFARYERRLAERDPAVAARRRTTFSFLLRLAVALVALVGAWTVLSVFPETSEVAGAFLASGAVLALVAGVALSTPLANIGSGVLLAFSQPVRLGDRISVGEHTGVVEEITLSYTALVTDEGRHVFVPNRTMVSDVLVNRSVGDPRRIVTVELPVSIRAPLAEARRLVADAAAQAQGPGSLTATVHVGSVGEKVVWLNVVGHAPPDADVPALASAIRERGLAALADADLLPAA
ncbi:MAG TPA: mechanosensitive ion channel family protein [Gaiellaceae bacterium]|nr:mechanosensitive ion channel family protein [Gaiellaceae bacterium]